MSLYAMKGSGNFPPLYWVSEGRKARRSSDTSAEEEWEVLAGFVLSFLYVTELAQSCLLSSLLSSHKSRLCLAAKCMAASRVINDRPVC